MALAGAALWAALGTVACHPSRRAPPPPPPPPEGPPVPAVLRDRRDVDRYAGRLVLLEGQLDHERHVHGVLRLDTGLVVLLPNFYRAARGMAWHEFVGKRARVVGVLKAEGRLPGVPGPAVEVRGFEVLP